MVVEILSIALSTKTNRLNKRATKFSDKIYLGTTFEPLVGFGRFCQIWKALGANFPSVVSKVE